MGGNELSPARLPLLVRGIAPGEGFTAMGLPAGEGQHTGGVYLSPDGEDVWKPLDGCPAPGAGFHLATHEETVLRLMAGVVGFPENWRVEEAGGRRWLVRKLAYPVPEVYEREQVALDAVLQVEQAVRALNSKHWGLGSALRVAVDGDTYEPFLLGLATAQQVRGADDAPRFERWASDVAGYESLVLYRRAARTVVETPDWLARPYGSSHRWVYGSEYRPINSTWASIPDAVYVDSSWGATGVWTWVVVPGPLAPELADGYQLRWGYGPVQYE